MAPVTSFSRPVASAGRDQHVGRGEIRIHRTPAAALAAVVAARAPVEGASQDRKPRGNAGDLQLIGSTLDQELIAAGPRWREEDAIGMVGKALGAAEQADQAIYLVVPRLEIVVGDRPVITQAVDAPAAKVIGAEAERDASPMIGAAAQHPEPEPLEVRSLRPGKGLARQFPAAQSGVELAEGALLGAHAPARRLVGPLEHRRVFGVVPHRAGFQHDDSGAGPGQHVGSHAAAGARADDAHVVGVVPEGRGH